MPSITFFPSTDDALLGWSLNFKTLITATPTAYGLTSALATAYGALHDAYATALAACEPSVRTKPAVATKNTARTNLKNNARLLANLVNGTASVTDAQKLTLGLNVRTMPSPIPAPSSSPVIQIVSVSGRRVRLLLKNGETGKRGKPGGVHGAAVFSYVGPTAPDSTDDWKFEGNTNVTSVLIEFAESVSSGATVWFNAFWFNPRSLSGPPATPVSTNLPGGAAFPLAA
ncbi:hypothetical protein BH09PLA1_BH09PLA1_25400 [soil metagenome]